MYLPFKVCPRLEFGDSDVARKAEILSASLSLCFFESPSKLLNVLARSLPIRITRIAVKLERTGAQRRLKIVASERDRLIVIIWARDLEFHRCRYPLCTSLKDEKYGRDRFHVDTRSRINPYDLWEMPAHICVR